MKRQSVRVVIASEYPQVRHFLGGVIERGDGAVIVGEAKDASKALTLTRNLKPDIAVIDCYLPHRVGLDAIPLSRIGGLDIAQTIFEEIPNTRVILLNNLDTVVLSEHSLSSDAAAIHQIESLGANISFVPQDPPHEVMPANAIVFAGIELKQEVVLRQQTTKITDKVIFFGALGIAGGWLLTLTMFLAPVGIPIALAGAVMVVLGLAGKPAASLWQRIKSGSKRG